MKNKCVYRHRRLDNNEIFYIGVGDCTRPYQKYNRNIFWKRITNKTKYEIEILVENINEKDALELEIFLIELYGRKNLNTGTLCNLTDGGEGCRKLKHTIESREKMSKACTGRKLSKQAIEKCREALYKKIINTESLIIYKNIDEVLKEFKTFNKRSLRGQINGNLVNKTKFMYLDDYNNNIDIRKKDHKQQSVIDIYTNEIFKSISQASRIKNIPISTLHKYLKGFRSNPTNLRLYAKEATNNT